MNTRQCLKPNEHNKANSRTVLSNKATWRRQQGRCVENITWLAGTQGVQNKTVSTSRDNTFVTLFCLYLSSFFRLLHILFCKCNCKILWYWYIWHLRDIRFQTSTRLCLKQVKILEKTTVGFSNSFSENAVFLVPVLILEQNLSTTDVVQELNYGSFYLH